MVGLDASSLHDYFGYQTRVFRTLAIFHGLVPRSCSSLPLLPFRATLLRIDSFTKLDLQFELQSLPISLLFCFLLLVGR